MTDIQPVEELGGDPVLRLFARLAQEADLTMGITLSVSGAAVSGLLIGRDKWVSEFARAMSAAGEFGRGLGDAIEQGFRESDLERPTDEEIFYGFIHLKDARLVSADALVPTGGRGLLWRGRISEVAGWSLGNLARPS